MNIALTNTKGPIAMLLGTSFALAAMLGLVAAKAPHAMMMQL